MQEQIQMRIQISSSIIQMIGLILM